MPSKPYTVVEICALQVLYKHNQNIVIVSDQRTRAETVLSQIRETVLSVPERLRTRITKDNVSQINFDNGCTIRATKVEYCRGLSINTFVIAQPISSKTREQIDVNLMPVLMSSRKALVLELDDTDVEAFAKELLDTDKTILGILAK